MDQSSVGVEGLVELGDQREGARKIIGGGKRVACLKLRFRGGVVMINNEKVKGLTAEMSSRN